VYFLGSYNAILGRPCYAKFMAIPNYTYLKPKMPGLHGIITTFSSFRAAYTYERANWELASVLADRQDTTPKHQQHGGPPDRHHRQPQVTTDRRVARHEGHKRRHTENWGCNETTPSSENHEPSAHYQGLMKNQGICSNIFT
jgi:hypothetical protein